MGQQLHRRDVLSAFVRLRGAGPLGAGMAILSIAELSINRGRPLVFCALNGGVLLMAGGLLVRPRHSRDRGRLSNRTGGPGFQRRDGLDAKLRLPPRHPTGFHSVTSNGVGGGRPFPDGVRSLAKVIATQRRRQREWRPWQGAADWPPDMGRNRPDNSVVKVPVFGVYANHGRNWLFRAHGKPLDSKWGSKLAFANPTVLVRG